MVCGRDDRGELFQVACQIEEGQQPIAKGRPCNWSPTPPKSGCFRWYPQTAEKRRGRSWLVKIEDSRSHYLPILNPQSLQRCFMMLAFFFLVGTGLVVGPWFVPQLHGSAPVVCAVAWTRGSSAHCRGIAVITKLYRKASANMAFVRTGMGGAQRVSGRRHRRVAGRCIRSSPSRWKRCG